LGDRAGLFFRVSTGGQDEDNQVPETMQWVSDKGYEVAPGCTWTLHGKSATKGKQQPALDEVLKAFEEHIISVLVVWKDDRLERRGSFRMFDFMGKVIDAGGRVEFVTQPHLNDLSTMGGRISLVAMAEMAKEEIKSKMDRQRIADDKIAANGAFRGRHPFGYTVGRGARPRRDRPVRGAGDDGRFGIKGRERRDGAGGGPRVWRT
jgi:DNA invertase Pin-like site-specific DNA recombinase